MQTSDSVIFFAIVWLFKILHGIDDRLHALDLGTGANAVPQIKDVAVEAAHFFQDTPCLGDGNLGIGLNDRRIEIALHADIRYSFNVSNGEWGHGPALSAAINF